jgi:hypothetical protein
MRADFLPNFRELSADASDIFGWQIQNCEKLVSNAPERCTYHFTPSLVVDDISVMDSVGIEIGEFPIFSSSSYLLCHLWLYTFARIMTVKVNFFCIRLE